MLSFFLNRFNSAFQCILEHPVPDSGDCRVFFRFPRWIDQEGARLYRHPPVQIFVETEGHLYGCFPLLMDLSLRAREEFRSYLSVCLPGLSVSLSVRLFFECLYTGMFFSDLLCMQFL